MTKKEENKYEVTPSILRHVRFVDMLKKNFDKVLNQFWWQKKVCIEDKIKYIKELANARSALFQECEKKYPAIKGKDYFIQGRYIVLKNL